MTIEYIKNITTACIKHNIDMTKYTMEEKLKDLLQDKTKIRDEIVSETKQMIQQNTESPTNNNNNYSDDYLYQKTWAKLSLIHKNIKIKEYINSLLINDENEKQEIKEKLLTLVKNKLLTKKETVNYDSTRGKIINIPCVQYRNGRYIIEI